MVMKKARSAVALGVGAALMLAACASGAAEDKADDQPAGGSTGPVVAGEATPDAFKGSKFAFSGHGGTSQEAQDAILKDFAEIVGANYAPDGPPELAKIQAQVESGQVSWDLVVLSDVVANDPELCGTLVEKIDTSKIDTSNLPEVAPLVECGVPMNANGWSLAYNTEAFAGADDMTWERFFDTENYPGKRAIYSAIPQLQLEIGLLGDGVAVDDLYPLDVDRALAKYDSIRDDLLFYTTGSESQQMMESDQIVACLCWSGRVYTIIDNGGQWALSDEAPPQLRIDYWGIPKGGKNVDLAHAAINYFLGKEQQELWQTETAYPSMNRETDVELSEAADAVNVLDERFNANRVDIDFWVENQATLTDRWTTWVSQ